MTHTALTTDEEIRRLRKLGERQHDWCESDPRSIPLSEYAFLARLRQTLGAALVRLGNRLVARPMAGETRMEPGS